MRDKFADMIDDFFGVDSAYFGVDKYKLADHLIANGVTVQEWISVKDRLPKDGDVVLVCNVDMMRPILCQWDAREDGWLGGKWAFGRSAFTHWMPLPQPPKGE